MKYYFVSFARYTGEKSGFDHVALEEENEFFNADRVAQDRISDSYPVTVISYQEISKNEYESYYEI